MKEITGVLTEDQVSDLTDDEYVGAQLVETSRARQAYVDGLPFESRMTQAAIPTTTVAEKSDDDSSKSDSGSGGSSSSSSRKSSGSRSGRTTTRKR